jgi:hypothetical protein
MGAPLELLFKVHCSMKDQKKPGIRDFVVLGQSILQSMLTRGRIHGKMSVLQVPAHIVLSFHRSHVGGRYLGYHHYGVGEAREDG